MTIHINWMDARDMSDQKIDVYKIKNRRRRRRSRRRTQTYISDVRATAEEPHLAHEYSLMYCELMFSVI